MKKIRINGNNYNTLYDKNYCKMIINEIRKKNARKKSEFKLFVDNWRNRSKRKEKNSKTEHGKHGPAIVLAAYGRPKCDLPAISKKLQAIKYALILEII